jgi:hypothetical protein
MHLQRKKKIKLRTYVPNLIQEEEVPKNDIFLIRLAAITESIVITTDSRLRDKLISKGLTEKYGIQVKHPNDFKLIKDLV